MSGKINQEIIMEYLIRNFDQQDYEAALKLWKQDTNIGLSSADDKTNIHTFLKRNPELSKVAIFNEQIVATALCGQDGRRGYLYHLYVEPNYQRKGLGKALVKACLNSLRKENIEKCHVFVFEANGLGKNFWSGADWSERKDIAIFSKNA
jgi:N-acetylglutamate synthase